MSAHIHVEAPFPNEAGAPLVRPPDEAGKQIGEEAAGSHFGRQSYADTCAIRCQEYVIECFTGEDVDEDELVEEAAALNLYTPGTPGSPGGTRPEAVGALLELHGIPTHRYFDANVFNLTAELAQGHKVILGLDTELLRSGHPIIMDLQSALDIDEHEAGHAVIVSGIDTTDPDHAQVIVSDPETGEAAARYPMDRFLAAWSTSEFFMVATREPAPAWLPEMAHFDYEAGHLRTVAGLPYDELLQLEHEPAELAAHLEHHAAFADDGADDAGSFTEPGAAEPPRGRGADPPDDGDGRHGGDGHGPNGRPEHGHGPHPGDHGHDPGPDPTHGHETGLDDLDPGLDHGHAHDRGVDLGHGGGDDVDDDPYGVRHWDVDDPHGFRHAWDDPHDDPGDHLPHDGMDPYGGVPADDFPY